MRCLWLQTVPTCTRKCQLRLLGKKRAIITAFTL
jgi:hypothetical protein